MWLRNKQEGISYKYQMKYFRALRLLNVHFNFCCSQVLWPILLLYFILNQSATLFILIRCHDHIPTLALLMFVQVLVAWCLFGYTAFPPFHGTETGSKEFLRSIITTSVNWSARQASLGELTLLRKSVSAMRHLRCDVAGLFDINSATVFSLYAVVIDMTVNAILLL